VAWPATMLTPGAGPRYGWAKTTIPSTPWQAAGASGCGRRARVQRARAGEAIQRSALGVRLLGKHRVEG
jgi:hypothetical protein